MCKATATYLPSLSITKIYSGTGTSDNYAYLVVDDKSKRAIIIDPANPEEVAPVLIEKIKAGDINLTDIFNTHHHRDHAGGNKTLQSQLKEYLPEGTKLQIVGGKDCDGVNTTPKDREEFSIGDINVKGYYTPCHTQDSICWLLEDSTGRVVFTGDTLFHGGRSNLCHCSHGRHNIRVCILMLAGCGRFFEGTAEEMHTALNKTLASLPDDTTVFVSSFHHSS